MDNERLEQASETAQEYANRAGAPLKDKARAFGQKAQEWQRQAVDKTRDLAQNTDDYVRENPWNAVIYVGIGCFLVGWLMGRSRD